MSISEKKTILADLHYLPSIEYFCLLDSYETIILENHEHFIKQTYRNRCHILGPNGRLTLSVPVIGGRKKIAMKDLRIDHDQKWSNNHWRAIQSAYGKSPFYEFFRDDFRAIFQKKEKFLVDLNCELLTLCLDLLGLKKKLIFSEKYENDPKRSNISDFRSVIHPKISFEQRVFYRPVPYPQVFGKDFVPNLSIIDLLMCEGPNSLAIVRKSTRK
ncbi:MAG: WbqC family protein [Cytophagales bacterium]|nr:WbqC family protein [Cytophagales bacterium]